MNLEEALRLLQSGSSGIKEWNERRQAEDVPTGLVKADLRGMSLKGVDFHGINLFGSNLEKADLTDALLQGAGLISVNLDYTNLSGANLQEANLVNANLHYANLLNANLEGAKLCGAGLGHAVLNNTTVRYADFSKARFRKTVVGCDMSVAVGLCDVIHWESSYIDVNSILTFKEELPEVFLRGCGLRDEEIAYFRQIVNGSEPIRFYTCFISYSIQDEEFATRLHNDFQAAGIRCWKWDHDADIGRSLWGEIDKAIRVHDKVVLIASEASLNSPAVEAEIERAICEEHRRKREKQARAFDGDIDVLFPVRLDDYIFKGWEHERKVDVTKKVIADASGSEMDMGIYGRVRDRLIRTLLKRVDADNPTPVTNVPPERRLQSNNDLKDFENVKLEEDIGVFGTTPKNSHPEVKVSDYVSLSSRYR